MAEPLGALWVEQLSTEASDLEALSMHWKRLAEQTQDADLSCDLYARLSRLALRRGDRDQALAWQTKRLELQPGSLDALHFLTVANMLPGQETELERLAVELGEQLADGDGLAYDFLATRLKIGRGAFQAARPNVGRASGVAAPPLWALRLETAYSQAAGDDRTLLAVYRTLRERAHQPLDVATLSLRAAEAASRLAQPELAKDEIQRAHEIAPDNVVILAARAEVLRNHAEHADAAEAFETLAAATHSKSQQVDALYQAACIWLDVLGDRRRGTSALKEAAAIDCPHPELLERLRQLHAQSSGFEGLGELIQRQSAEEAAEEAGASVEIAQTLALMQTGQWSEARQVILALLERQPENTEALSTSAEVHFRAREWLAAEQAWRRIVDGGARDRWRLAALRGLASLYEGELADSERARAVHMHLLVEDPDDLTVRRRLIRTLTGLGRPEEAMEHQRELVTRARGDEERRQYLLELVELCEKSPLGQREAEALLEQAHRTWPESTQVLKAEVAHYRLIGDHGTARVIVERATNAARNAIYAGRLEPSLFRTLEVAARLGGDPDTARAAQAALAALRGQSIGLPGVGSQAGQQRFDDLIAPTPLSAGFRSLLYAAGAAIERAYAIDPRSYDPKPLPEPFASQVRSVAATFGLKEVRVVVSARTGCNCVCLYGEPIYVVFGQQLLDHSSPHVRDFLLLRALKLAQAHGCAISRMPPNELWGVVAGFLACFAPPWQANGLDAQRLVMARNKIRPHVTATPDPALTALTSAVTANIVPQAARVGEALGRWAARVALFGVGDLGMALESLWAAAELGPAIPKDVDGRIRWIASDGAARDLVGYSVSEAHTEARRRAGLTAVPR
jgi:tetratricopeptide (TPR) repeat protein